MRRFRQILIEVVTVLLLFSSVVYGDTWTTSKRLTNTAGDSMKPTIGVEDSNIYVVRDGPSAGNHEICFKKGALD
jgi:hypothetical protein